MIIKDGHLLDWMIGRMKKYFHISKKLKHGLKEKTNTEEAVEYCLLINLKIKILYLKLLSTPLVRLVTK